MLPTATKLEAEPGVGGGKCLTLLREIGRDDPDRLGAAVNTGGALEDRTDRPGRGGRVRRQNRQTGERWAR